MQLTARLPPGLDDRVVAREAVRQGVVVRPMSACYVAAPAVSALSLGFTGYDRPVLLAGVDRLAAVLREVGA